MYKEQKPNVRLMMALAALMVPECTTPAVKRCDPVMDDQTLRDATTRCAVYGRRLTMDDIGGGDFINGPKPLPACKGVAL